jgi:hypothetical protein
MSIIKIIKILTNKMNTLIYSYNNVLICIKSYMIRPALVHYQEVYSCIKQSLRLKNTLHKCALTDEGPVWLETCKILCTVKHYFNHKEVSAFCWFTLKPFYNNIWNEKWNNCKS